MSFDTFDISDAQIVQFWTDLLSVTDANVDDDILNPADFQSFASETLPSGWFYDSYESLLIHFTTTLAKRIPASVSHENDSHVSISVFEPPHRIYKVVDGENVLVDEVRQSRVGILKISKPRYDADGRADVPSIVWESTDYPADTRLYPTYDGMILDS